MSDYAKGFKDGFLAGVEEGKKLNDKTYMKGLTEGMKKTLPPPYVPSTLPGYTLERTDTCPKCGIKIGGAMGYVCSSVNCPTYYKTWTGPSHYSDWSPVPGTVWAAGSQGAVGSMSANYESNVAGANGPGGPSEPVDYSMR